MVLQVVTSAEHAASDGYEALAPYYDAFTEHPHYPVWIADVAAFARECGAEWTSVLDVACGTGKSLAPLLEDGVTAVGADAVPSMIEVARRRHGDRVDLRVADMTRLPKLGEFDLVLCMNDAVNCLLTPEAVERAFVGIAANLRPGGTLVFDANTTAAFRDHFAVEDTRTADGLTFRWNGSFDGERGVADLDVFRGDEQLAHSVHVLQLHSPAVIDGALRAAGLEVAGRCGYDYEGERAPVIDETTFKVLYVVKRTVHPPS